MQSLVASGRIVDLILLVMLLELAVLLLYRRLTGRGLKPLDLGLLLLPGLFLLLALRAGLTGGAWTAVLAWLGAALLAPGRSLAANAVCLRRIGASSPLDRKPCAPKLKGLRDLWESCP